MIKKIGVFELNKIYEGDSIVLLKQIPDNSINLIFADPPYNLSGETFRTVKSGKFDTLYKGNWDVKENIYEFNEQWLSECARIIKDDGTIWVSGTLHNYPSIGVILKKLNLYIINDVVWYKPNATPLLSANRLVPSTEIIFVASKSKKYYFDYQKAKEINGGKQMRNLWTIPAEKHKTKHPTEKPESLLNRIILLGSKENDIILDPFIGSGTTGVVAKKLNRNFIGFEINSEFVKMATQRINDVVILNTLFDEYNL